MIVKVVKTLHKSTILLKSQMLEYTYSSLGKPTLSLPVMLRALRSKALPRAVPCLAEQLPHTGRQ